jgi:hypothetical protein
MENTLATFLADITVGQEQQYKNMVVFALLLTKRQMWHLSPWMKPLPKEL